MPRPAPARFLAAVLLALLVAPAAADRLITHDGRMLEVKKARKLESGDYRLVFESGELDCPAKYVASVEIEGDMSDYVPANEDEKKKLADGYVRFRGKWLTKPAYQSELKKEAELSRARTAELAAHSSYYDGWKKETKHFQLQSNTSPEILDQYAELLEAYYDLMDQRVGIDPSPMLKKTKMKVSIYKNRTEFRELTRVEASTAGFFDYVDGELHFYHDYQDPSVSEWIALHEGTHLLTFLIEPQARPWIWVNEGVADYFGTASVTRNKRGKLEIEPGQLSLERVLDVQEAMAKGTHVPLEKLFLIPKGEGFGPFEYAHAWAFVYFLNTAKPEYQKAFKKFFKELYTLSKGVAFDLEQSSSNKFGSWKVVRPTEVRRLLLDRLGLKDVVALEQEWIAYITGIPIDAPRARFQRGLAAVYQNGEDVELRGLEDLEAAIAAGIDDPQAFWGRAILRMVVKGGVEASLADLEQAVALAPLDAGLHANLAQLVSGLNVRTPGLTLSFGDEQELVDDDAALEKAERHFGLAAELAPENELVRTSRETFLDLLQKKTGSR